MNIQESMAGFDDDEEFLEQMRLAMEASMSQDPDFELNEAIRRGLLSGVDGEEENVDNDAEREFLEYEDYDIVAAESVLENDEGTDVDADLQQALQLSQLDMSSGEEMGIKELLEEILFLDTYDSMPFSRLEDRLGPENMGYIQKTVGSLTQFLQKYPATFMIGYALFHFNTLQNSLPRQNYSKTTKFMKFVSPDGFVSRIYKEVVRDVELSRQLSANSERISSEVLQRMPNCDELVRDSLYGFNFCFEVGAITREEKDILKDQLLHGEVYDEDIVRKLPDFFQAKLVEEQNSRYRLGACKIGMCDDEITQLKRISALCHHEEEVCQECIVKNIAADFHKTVKPEEITCPCCQVPISPVEVIHHVRNHPEIQERAETFYLMAKLRLLNFKNCAKEGCRGGGLLEDMRPNFTCIVCQSITCSICAVLWHDGLTCAEYAALQKAQEAQMDAETQHYVDETTRSCPTCERRICKAEEDCDVVMCCLYGDHACRHKLENNINCDHGGIKEGLPFCGTRFCWVCRGKIDPDGTRHHIGDCKYNFK